MKNYIKPSIVVLEMRRVELLNASALNDETAGGNESLGRESDFDFEDDED